MESVVRTLKGSLVPLVLCAGLVLVSGKESPAKPIDAVKGKSYKLTKKHGPWMVMVASFHEPPPERKGQGLSPIEAANELVYELRTKHIPAYTFSQEDVIDQIQTPDMRDPQKQRVGEYVAQQGGVCVLAGNYLSADADKARETRDFIKKFQPKFLQGDEATAGDGLLHKLKNGGLYRTTPARKGPLAGAFLTINPLLTPDEVKGRNRDPLLLKLNAGDDISLLKNRGKYTVVVASFYGRSKSHVGNTVTTEDLQQLKIDSHLDEAADSAWQLARALRMAKSLGYERDYDAYVYHDHYGSIVTVGAFEVKDDSQITKLQNHFGAKVAAVNDDGSTALGAEAFAIPKLAAPNVKRQSWIFDPYPRVMEVPSL